MHQQTHVRAPANHNRVVVAVRVFVPGAFIDPIAIVRVYTGSVQNTINVVIIDNNALHNCNGGNCWSID